jgi:hypothetical protein
VNLSDSGVLFGVLLGPTGFAPGTPVEVILSPPFQVGSLAIGKQFCAAEVVRATDAGEVAARFEECRFLLEGRGSPETGSSTRLEVTTGLAGDASRFTARRR